MPIDDGAVLLTEDQTSGVSTETGVETETPAEETAPETADQQPQFNWDSDDNPWKQNFKGLQGTTQQAREAYIREQQRAAALEAQLAQYEFVQLQQQTATLPPEIRNQQIMAFQQQKLLQAQAAQLQQREMMLAQQEAQREQKAKPEVAHLLAEKYGVPMQALLKYNTPEDMENTAILLKEHRQAQRQQSRQAQGQDRFEGAGLGSTPPNAPKSFDEAGARMAELAKRLGYS